VCCVAEPNKETASHSYPLLPLKNEKITKVKEEKDKRYVALGWEITQEKVHSKNSRSQEEKKKRT
jgi:hypothetical protein